MAPTELFVEQSIGNSAAANGGTVVAIIVVVVVLSIAFVVAVCISYRRSEKSDSSATGNLNDLRTLGKGGASNGKTGANHHSQTPATTAAPSLRPRAMKEMDSVDLAAWNADLTDFHGGSTANTKVVSPLSQEPVKKTGSGRGFISGMLNRTSIDSKAEEYNNTLARAQSVDASVDVDMTSYDNNQAQYSMQSDHDDDASVYSHISQKSSHSRSITGRLMMPPSSSPYRSSGKGMHSSGRSNRSDHSIYTISQPLVEDETEIDRSGDMANLFHGFTGGSYDSGMMLPEEGEEGSEDGTDGIDVLMNAAASASDPGASDDEDLTSVRSGLTMSTYNQDAPSIHSGTPFSSPMARARSRIRSRDASVSAGSGVLATQDSFKL